jgi:hypothetical protein
MPGGQHENDTQLLVKHDPFFITSSASDSLARLSYHRGDFKFSTFSSPSLIASDPARPLVISERLDPPSQFVSTHPRSSCTPIYTPLQLSPVLVRFFFLFQFPPLMTPDIICTPTGSPFKNARFPRQNASCSCCSHYLLHVKCRYFVFPRAALQEPQITVHYKVVQLLTHSVLVPNPIRFPYPVAVSLPQIPRQESMSWHRISEQGRGKDPKTIFSPIELVLHPSFLRVCYCLLDLNSTRSTSARTGMEI